MEIINIYESASTDGYTSTGDRKYFTEKSLAIAYGKNKHGNYVTDPICYYAINIPDDGYLILASKDPVFLADSEEEKKKIKDHALSKLSSEEREVLGI